MRIIFFAKWLFLSGVMSTVTTGKSNITLRLVPFADAGQTGGNYRVLFPQFDILKEMRQTFLP